MFNFTRCRRADGSHYGTAGVCRKGSEDPLTLFKNQLESKTKELRPKLIGQGAFGKVYDVGDGVVIKHGRISEQEIKSLLHLKSLPEVPRVIAFSKESNNNNNDVSVLAMSKAPGVPFSQLDEYDQEEEWENFLPTLRKLHKRGVAHNDLHSNNVFIDEETGKFTVIDFGQASLNDPVSQINDLTVLSLMLSEDRGNLLIEIIDRNNSHSSALDYKPIKEQQRVIDAIWDDIEEELL